jgi:hypothetical protein
MPSHQTWQNCSPELLHAKSPDLTEMFSRTAACQVTRLDRNVLQNCCMPSHQTWQKCSPELLHAKSPDLTEMFSRTAACQVTRLDRNVLQNCCMPSHQTWQKCSPELLHAKSPDLTEMFSRTATCQVTGLDRNFLFRFLSEMLLHVHLEQFWIQFGLWLAQTFYTSFQELLNAKALK